LKRIIIIGTVISALAGAAIAYGAALNNYTANIKFTTSKAGSKSKPVPIGWSETLGASNATAGKVAAPLVNIKTTIYGLKSNLKYFKTCSSKVIDAQPKFNKACPKGSLVASGHVTAAIGGPTLAAPGTPCLPDLAVYNGGGGKEWYFFTTQSATQCGGLTTGSTPAYPGTVKQVGPNLVLNVPLPPYVSTMVAHQPNLYGSLQKQVLNVTPATTKVNGKTVGATEAVGCKGGKRPWSVVFTAVPAAGQPGQSATVSGSSKCSG
jgi:hypothetical protein